MTSLENLETAAEPARVREAPEFRRTKLIEWGYLPEEVDELERLVDVTTRRTIRRTLGILDGLTGFGWTKVQVRAMTLAVAGLLTNSAARTRANLEALERYGFTRSRLLKMGRLSPAFIISAATKVAQLLRHLESHGCTPAQIVVIGYKTPRLLGSTPEFVDRRIAVYTGRGIAKKDVISMAVRSSAIMRTTPDRAKAVFRNLREQHGFSDAQIDAAIRVAPGLMVFLDARTDGIILNLIGYGFSKEQIPAMAARFGLILTAKPETTNIRLETIERNGYGREEVRQMMAGSPSIAVGTPARLAEGLQVFRKIGYDVKSNPMRLTFSPALIRARWIILSSRAVGEPMKSIFYTNADFRKRFGLDRAETLAFDPGHQAFLAA